MAADPADPGPRATLASLAENDHDYPRAAALLRSALLLTPEDVVLANRLGYAEAYAGNLDAAVAALHRYRELRPEEANPLDSLGDVYLYFGRLADAERCYLDAHKRNPEFNGGAALYKAAWSRLNTGDIAAAGKIFDRFLAARPGNPAREYQRAEWLWLSGRREDAVQALEAFATDTERGPLRELAARARAQLALWALASGDGAAARTQAERAVALAGPQTAALAATARFLAEPPASATEWAVRAERAFPSPAQAPMKQYALACALLSGGEFQAAVPLMREIYARWTPSGDPAIPVMLAWAYTGAGRPGDAAPLIARNPIPQGTGLNIFTGLWYPRIHTLRRAGPRPAPYSGTSRNTSFASTLPNCIG